MALMKESQQMLSLISFCGYYLLVLTLVYLVQAVYQLKHIDKAEFRDVFVG